MHQHICPVPTTNRYFAASAASQHTPGFHSSTLYALTNTLEVWNAKIPAQSCCSTLRSQLDLPTSKQHIAPSRALRCCTAPNRQLSTAWCCLSCTEWPLCARKSLGQHCADSCPTAALDSNQDQQVQHIDSTERCCCSIKAVVAGSPMPWCRSPSVD